MVRVTYNFIGVIKRSVCILFIFKRHDSNVSSRTNLSFEFKIDYLYKSWYISSLNLFRNVENVSLFGFSKATIIAMYVCQAFLGYCWSPFLRFLPSLIFYFYLIFFVFVSCSSLFRWYFFFLPFSLIVDMDIKV